MPSLGVVASRLALTVVGGLCLVGCFPYHYTLRPGVTGVVLDARTGTPVANATVAVRSRDSHGQISEVTLATYGTCEVSACSNSRLTIVGGVREALLGRRLGR